MTFALRDYQHRIVDEARDALVEHGSVLIQSPTGSGKTNLATYMIGRAAERGKRAWFVCHRDFLLSQTAATFDTVGVRYGFIAANREFNPHRHVQIAAIDTLRRRLDRLKPPDIIVWDECHHLAATSWKAVREWADAGGTRHVGLSATPARLDGRGLDDAFRAMVRGPSVAWLIERGFLSRYRAYAPTAPDLTGVHTRHGDYQRDELAGIMDTDTIAGNIVGTYKQLAGGKRAIYFAVSIAHSKHIAAAFNAAGVAARHLDASSSTVERVGAARDMARGIVCVLTNVDLFGEGFDLSAQAGEDVPIECVGLCRPTQSLALHLQQIGRALRPKPDPAIILDHAGNLMRHGLPDDDREWSLKGVKRSRRDQEYIPPVRQCPSCFGVFGAAARTCPYCGTLAVAPSPREVTEIAVDLAEVDAERLRRARRAEQSRATTMDDLVRLGVQRGYKSPERWAAHVLEARAGRRVSP